MAASGAAAPEARRLTTEGRPVEAPGVTSRARGSTEFPWQHCERVGQTGIERLGAMYDIATSYDSQRMQDCRTAALLSGPDAAQTASWRDYLINYTIALAGCPLVVAPLRGGISVFGPANTRFIGVAHPALGRDDVGLLLDMYVAPFAAAFSLPEMERAALEAYLWSTAETELDASVAAGLSTCARSSTQ